MALRKFHVDEVDIDEALVARLVAAQFPDWASLPVAPVDSSGTDNAIYRLGAELAARLPRVEGALAAADKERRWLPVLAPHLPVPIPRTRRGRPARRGVSVEVVDLPLARGSHRRARHAGTRCRPRPGLLPARPASWARSRGWALSWAAIALPYYLETNPVVCAAAHHAVEAVLAER